MGTHEYEDDPRNENVWISVNGELLRRPDAKISVLDAGFLLGDGVWEAFRLHQGVLVFLDDHLERLWHGAEVIDLEMPLSREQLVGRIEEVIEANEMYDGVHIRLIVTRGLKPTPYQAPWVISSLPTRDIMPEHKSCLVYTTDAADDNHCGDHCGRRTVQKEITRRREIGYGNTT